ncbi:MAG: hypothetical protein RMJ43_06295 [Chloroherpetonaceae bacterium]|nr:hypothetical protein [Chthonomonadaceae bacterium]MDW8207428.1 hypothetical protein [Chloroherpetonaceae bacterium]
MPLASRSVSSEETGWLERATETLEPLVERYTRLRGIEHNGRLYEHMRLRSLYCRVATLFGDPVLPPATTPDLRTQSPLNLRQVKKLYIDSGYYEIVNLIYCIFYLPLVAYLILQGQTVITLYATAWIGVHALCIVLERYKRALALAWLTHQHSQSTWDASSPEASPHSAFPAWMHRWYFQPLCLESEKLYQALGTERFRLFVVWLKQLTALNPEAEQPKRKIRYIEGATPAHIEQFLEETRISEVTHVIGLLSLVPYAILFWRDATPTGMVTLTPLIWGNLYSTLLQRYHRVRIARILNRRRIRTT